MNASLHQGERGFQTVRRYQACSVGVTMSLNRSRSAARHTPYSSQKRPPR
jgi:hypothetical protein